MIPNHTDETIAQQVVQLEQQQADFLSSVVSEFNRSKKRLFMDVAQRYYENDPDIVDAKRTVVGRNNYTNEPMLVETTFLANNKLTHNFLKKLTRQKIGYMLSKPFILNTVIENDELAPVFFTEAKKVLGKDFFRMIKNVGRDSIVKGIGWLMVYYDTEGSLKFKRCAPEEVIPFWADSDHTELDAVVRHYVVEVYTGDEKKKIRHVDFYTPEGIFYYVYNDEGKLTRDTTQGEAGIAPHFYVRPEDRETMIGRNWARIPFIPFKYDPDEQSLLSRIKTLIDDYDRKTSDVANDIDDHPNSITVVKNYDGTDKEEFVQNKNVFRTIFVSDDGDAKGLQTPLNVSEVDKHLQRLREDIYEFGQGVNTADKDIRDTSGVALRFMYADLDMDCIDWGGEMERSLELVFWFVQQDILAKTGVDYSMVEYAITFDTDVIVNETEAVTNATMSVGVISAETIAAMHPWTKDAQAELARMRMEETESYELAAEYGETEPLNNSMQGQRTEVTN